jgi:hypothetical protein
LRASAPVALVVAVVAGLAPGCSSGSSTSTRDVENERAKAAKRLPPIVDPYKASMAFAACMRGHGVPHPNPDRAGNFHLTLHDERLMRRAGPRKHEAADKACFHYLKPVVSTEPLSRHAKLLAGSALQGFSRCMRTDGYDFYSDPVVRNYSRGRAFFGFSHTDPAIMEAQRTQRFLRARTSCEKKLNAKLDVIIADDRGEIPY